MIIYGMYRLLLLCDMIETDQTIKKRSMIKEIKLEDKIPTVDLDDTHNNDISQAMTERTIDNLYEVDLDADKYSVITLHQVPNQWTGKMRRPLVGFSIFAMIGMGLGFSCGNFIFLSRLIVTCS